MLLIIETLKSWSHCFCALSIAFKTDYREGIFQEMLLKYSPVLEQFNEIHIYFKDFFN